jgi:hypothetical protein
MGDEPEVLAAGWRKRCGAPAAMHDIVILLTAFGATCARARLLQTGV